MTESSMSQKLREIDYKISLIEVLQVTISYLYFETLLFSNMKLGFDSLVLVTGYEFTKDGRRIIPVRYLKDWWVQGDKEPELKRLTCKYNGGRHSLRVKDYGITWAVAKLDAEYAL